MNILELNFEKGWRGGERQTLYNMLGFRDASIHVHLLCRQNSAMESMAKEEGFEVHSFKSIVGVIFFLIRHGKKYHFLHAQTSQILTYCVFTKAFHGAKVIFTRRVNFTQKGFFTKLKYRFTDKLVVISPSVKNTLESFTGRNDIETISDIVVKQPINLSRAHELRDRLQINDRKIIATTSALTPDKDPFTMVEVIRLLSKRRNDFVFLHFGSGNLMPAISEKIKGYHLEHEYLLLGFVDHIHDFFPLIDIFLMTSVQEGLGSSALDAFLYRVPVVSTNAGGLADLVGDQRGILCNIGDSNALASGIESLLNDADKKEGYVNKAYEYVNHFHNQKYLTEKYLQILEKLAG